MDSAGVPSFGQFHRDQSGRKSGVQVRARGLPYSASEGDLKDFFVDFNVDENDIEILCNHSGRSTGIAIITFHSSREAQKAVKELNSKFIGTRYVELSVI